MKRPRFRLFPSTWILLGLLLSGVIVPNIAAYPFGWPWVIKVRPPVASDDAYRILAARRDMVFLSPSNIPLVLSPAGIACDLLFALAIVGVPTLAWEWRRRNRRSLWQFTLADLAITIGLVGAILATGRLIYNDVWCDARLKRQLAGSQLSADPDRWNYDARVYPHWVWRFPLPGEWRPYRRESVRVVVPVPYYLESGTDVVDLPPGAAHTIGGFYAPNYLRLQQVRLSPDDWQQLNRCRSLTGLELQHNNLSDVDVASYRAPETLKRLTIKFSDKLTDEGLAKFAVPRLESLILDHLPAVKGHTLGKFHGLGSVSISDLPLDDEGIRQIATVPGLKNLTILRALDVSPRGWLALQHCRKLNILQLEISEASDELIGVLAELPQLNYANITGCRFVSPDAWAELATSPSLCRLDIDEGTISGASLIALNRSSTLLSLKSATSVRLELTEGDLEQLTVVQQRQIALQVLQRESNGRITVSMKEFYFGDAPWPQ